MSGRPSPVMADVGTMFTNLRTSLFCQYSATLSPAPHDAQHWCQMTRRGHLLALVRPAVVICRSCPGSSPDSACCSLQCTLPT